MPGMPVTASKVFIIAGSMYKICPSIVYHASGLLDYKCELRWYHELFVLIQAGELFYCPRKL